MFFSEIPELHDLKRRLIRTVQNHKIAHAQLFAGREGGLGLPLALAYATYLTCENPGNEDACGDCNACQKNKKYVHPDVHFVIPVSSTPQITGKDVISKSYLNEWRQFLKQNPYGDINDWAAVYGGENKQALISRQESREIIKDLALRSFESKYKILIMWMPELLHISSANALLKILEEPTESTIFLLVTYDPDRLLPTILSRTQMVNIPPVSDKGIAKILEEVYDLSPDKATQITQISEGSVAEAFRMAEGAEDDNESLFQEWMRHCYTQDYEQMVRWADKFGTMNKSGQKSFLQYALSMIREVMIRNSESELLRVEGETRKFIENFGKVMELPKIDRVRQELEDAVYYLDRNANAKIVFLDLSIELGKILHQKKVTI